MNEIVLRQWIETNGQFTFSRSGGPGGQNVNKVNSRCQLRININDVDCLDDSERLRLTEKLTTKLTIEGDLIIQVQDERSQLFNRELALERMVATIKKALHRPRPRKATKPSKASQERRLTGKKTASVHKKNRSRPDSD